MHLVLMAMCPLQTIGMPTLFHRQVDDTLRTKPTFFSNLPTYYFMYSLFVIVHRHIVPLLYLINCLQAFLLSRRLIVLQSVSKPFKGETLIL